MRSRHFGPKCALCAAALLALAGGSPGQAADEQDFAQIEHGRYMVAAADCAACHTNLPNGAGFAGGRAIQTPFGMVASSNITPDKESGIGRWTDAEFEAAVREGKRPDGSHLYPAMPYPYYRKMTHADVLAMRAYLQTVPPVHNLVESNRLPFPFDIRASVGVWNAMYFSDEPFKADPRRSAEWNRGAYLVQGPGHCAACHTAKTILGGDHRDRAYQGYSLQGWFAPNLTDDNALGLGEWSQADIVAYLKGGHNRIAAASGPMAEVVADGSSQLQESDLRAIATYLKSEQSRSEVSPPVAADDPAMQAGAAIYQDVCSACHQLKGTGVPYLIPDLASASSVSSREPTSIIRVLLHGTQSVATAAEPTGASMPAFGRQLTDAQIAAVATFIRNSWGHAAAAVTESDVHKARKDSKS
ncbi:MAG: c-type cytochrome [Steroidobacteraceae bacterium]